MTPSIIYIIAFGRLPAIISFQSYVPEICFLKFFIYLSDLTHWCGQDCEFFCFLWWITYLVFLSLILRTSCLHCAHLIDTRNLIIFYSWSQFSSQTLPSYLFLVTVDKLLFLHKTVNYVSNCITYLWNFRLFVSKLCCL